MKHVFRHFPLPNHPYALIGSEAVEAAGEQGKFWEMEDRIFANNSQLSPEVIKQIAIDLGLDMKLFNAALEDHRYLPKIKADVDEGNRLGIKGTPTFIINGRQYEPNAPSYAQLDAAVKEALERGQ